MHILSILYYFAFEGAITIKWKCKLDWQFMTTLELNESDEFINTSLMQKIINERQIGLAKEKDGYMYSKLVGLE